MDPIDRDRIVRDFDQFLIVVTDLALDRVPVRTPRDLPVDRRQLIGFPLKKSGPRDIKTFGPSLGPADVLSDPIRILCQTIFVLYLNPHASMTLRPSRSSAFGTHKYKCAASAKRLGTGRARISAKPSVPYRFSRLCSGAIVPVRLANCQGGSASIVENLCVPRRWSRSALGSGRIAATELYSSNVNFL